MNAFNQNNTADDSRSPIDQRLFDLLVDGELSEPQRRRLLASLDDTPDGWRRCALAFLETQCLHGELGRISCARPDEARARKRSAGVFNRKHGQILLALAASFLLALGLGIYWRNSFVGDGDLLPPAVEVAESDAADDMPEDSGFWRLVSFPVSNGSDEVEMVQLPAVERDSIGEAWLINLPQDMPSDVVQAIEDSGLRVRSERRLLPLRMRDGRRLVVPVDQVEVRYVGASAYH